MRAKEKELYRAVPFLIEIYENKNVEICFEVILGGFLPLNLRIL